LTLTAAIGGIKFRACAFWLMFHRHDGERKSFGTDGAMASRRISASLKNILDSMR
jgi:hypothetical protein